MIKINFKVTVIVFFGIFQLIFFNSNAQQFAPVGAQWYYTSQGKGLVPIGSEFWNYKSEKDTSVQNRSCKKISVNYYKADKTIKIYSPIYIYEKEDTVFMYDKKLNKFLTHLIFNKKVNDTLVLDSYIQGSKFIIKEIVTINKLKKYKIKRIGAGYFRDDFFMDKIGGLNWFYFQALTTPESVEGDIRCYSDSQIDTNFWAKPCDYALTGISKFINAKTFTYPNPANNQLTIKLGQW